MGPTRMRDLVMAVVAVGVAGYFAVMATYRWFPPLTIWTGVSLLAVGIAEAAWGFQVRSKIRSGQIGVGAGRLHPLTVARAVVVGKASAWVGAPVLGWWLAVLAYLLPRRSTLRVAAADTGGAVVAAASALALVAAAVWLQHCCKSPPGQPDDPDDSPD